MYSRSTLGCEIDLKECFEKTEVGINALSGLMKIDLTGVMGPVVDRVGMKLGIDDNKIIDFLTVRTMENTTIMTYNYHVYTIFSDVLGIFILIPFINRELHSKRTCNDTNTMVP